MGERQATKMWDISHRPHSSLPPRRDASRASASDPMFCALGSLAVPLCWPEAVVSARVVTLSLPLPVLAASVRNAAWPRCGMLLGVIAAELIGPPVPFVGGFLDSSVPPDIKGACAEGMAIKC
jgi:hypothetical protein